MSWNSSLHPAHPSNSSGLGPLLLPAVRTIYARLVKDSEWDAYGRANRAAFRQLILRFEKPDGSIDFALARSQCGESFEQALALIAVGPAVQRPKSPFARMDSAFFNTPARERSRLQVLNGLSNKRNRYQPPRRVAGPNWNSEQRVGPYSDLVRSLQRRHLSKDAFGGFEATLSPSELAVWERWKAKLDNPYSVFREVLGERAPRMHLELASLALEVRTRQPRNDTELQLLKKILHVAYQQPTRYLTRADEAGWFPFQGNHGRGRQWPEEFLLKTLAEEHRLARPKMPLLDTLVERLRGDVSFETTSIIDRGHLTDALLSLQRTFQTKKQTFFVGKDYSASAITLQQMWREGHEVCVEESNNLWPGSPGNRLALDYPISLRTKQDHQEMGAVLEQWCAQHSHSTDLHILDDGAELLLELIRRRPEFANRCSAVEQTRFGANQLRNIDLPMPVANVAESAVKLSLESVLIGWSLGAEVTRQLDDWDSVGIGHGRQVALVGYGAVGRATARCLRETGFQVTVVDGNEEARDKARQEGFTVLPRDEAMKQADIVIGATGKNSLTEEDLACLPDGAKLFSASSSTVELAVQGAHVELQQSQNYRGYRFQVFDGKPNPVEPLHVRMTHSSEVIVYSGKQFLAANGLRPVNFTGAPEAIRPEFIQLTLALLYLGSVVAKQHLAQGHRGLISLDEDDIGRREQLRLARDFLAHLRSYSTQHVPPFVLDMAEEAYAEVLSKLASPSSPDVSAESKR